MKTNVDIIREIAERYQHFGLAFRHLPRLDQPYRITYKNHWWDRDTTDQCKRLLLTVIKAIEDGITDTRQMATGEAEYFAGRWSVAKMDHIVLIIDNNKHALAHVMQIVRRENAEIKPLVGALDAYCRSRLLSLLKDTRYADSCELEEVDNAVTASRHLARVNRERHYEFWKSVAQHYVNKHSEGVDMAWALTPGYN